ncbi:hypothetical protein OHC33_002848 [Knufia fluminis]|uniref:BTB domain-containing protein n=1 Tax=Knufia fluminis TaxID=191047 RepID=A0AAN8IQN9_9EURO|nr:hypothetical protein OHC33_002848 [Knufia fluminis]
MTESTDIECVQTQLSGFNGFDMKFLTLKVGQSAKVLHVHEGLLSSIPSLADIAMNGNNGPDDAIALSEYDAQATADVLHFVEQGSVEDLILRNVPDSSSARPDIHAGPHRYIGAYIAAHQLHLEDVQNSLLDILSSFYVNHLIQPEAILLLSKANLRTSKLYSLLMEEMARGTQAGFYNAREINSSSLLDDLRPQYKTAMAQWSPEDFLALTAQVGRLSPKKTRTMAVVAKVNPCLFHNHVRTPPCKSLKRKREDKGTAKRSERPLDRSTKDSLRVTPEPLLPSIEDDFDCDDDTPTRKRQRTRYSEETVMAGQESGNEEMEEANGQTNLSKGGRISTQHAQPVEQQASVTGDIVHEHSSIRSQTIQADDVSEIFSPERSQTVQPDDITAEHSPARSQTIQPDSPFIQVPSSQIDPNDEQSYDDADDENEGKVEKEVFRMITKGLLTDEPRVKHLPGSFSAGSRGIVTGYHEALRKNAPSKKHFIDHLNGVQQDILRNDPSARAVTWTPDGPLRNGQPVPKPQPPQLKAERSKTVAVVPKKKWGGLW